MKELQRLGIAAVAMILYGVAAEAQPAVRGSGTTNTVPIWTNGSILGNSIMSQSGGNINVSGGVVATSLSGNGSGVTNVNALHLGGFASNAFAQLGASSNTFMGNVSVNGALTLGGSINNTLTLLGNVADGNGNNGADVIGGYGGGNFPGNSVGYNVVGATIAGGGGWQVGTPLPNVVLAHWGTVGGGGGNR